MRVEGGAAADREQVERVVEQVQQADAVLLGRGVVVPEDQGDLDVAGPQQLQCLLGVGVGEAEREAGMLPGEDLRGLRGPASSSPSRSRPA